MRYRGQPNDNHPLEPHSDRLRYGNNAFNCVVFGTLDGSHLSLCDWLYQTIAAQLESPYTWRETTRPGVRLEICSSIREARIRVRQVDFEPPDRHDEFLA